MLQQQLAQVGAAGVRGAVQQAAAVLLRVRPSRQEDNATSLSTTPTTVQVGGDTFEFGHVFEPSATQQDIFEQSGCAVEFTLKGFNSTVFAYGQTGSGKTYTLGTAHNADNPGLIQRSVETLFASGAPQTVKASFIEIYQERFKDLLAPVGAAETLAVAAKAAQRTVTSSAEALEVLASGAERRTVGATLMNEASSRSHAVFALEVELTAADGKFYTPKLQFVDLAGSESAKRTGATGRRLSESANINQSLLALGKVLSALRDKKAHVPYRDSKLTTLLMDSLGGSARTVPTPSPSARESPHTRARALPR